MSIHKARSWGRTWRGRGSDFLGEGIWIGSWRGSLRERGAQCRCRSVRSLSSLDRIARRRKEKKRESRWIGLVDKGVKKQERKKARLRPPWALFVPRKKKNDTSRVDISRHP